LSLDDEIRTEFDSAVGVARQALEEFNRDQLVASKRGGPRLSPWWRVYVEASEIAARWHRELNRGSTGEEKWIDRELERLLDLEGEGREH
jgi:hypothetical protein